MNTNTHVSKETIPAIPANFTHYINGGYAKIYYNSTNNQILKVQPLF
jgi:hypothetical protein